MDENILSDFQHHDVSFVDCGTTTLATIYLADESEVVLLETITETYSLLQLKQQTHILPIVKEAQNESFVKLIQTYDITSIITVTKTFYPINNNQFVASRSLKEFNANLDEAGSEVNLNFELTDEENSDYDRLTNITNISYFNSGLPVIKNNVKDKEVSYFSKNSESFYFFNEFNYLHTNSLNVTVNKTNINQSSNTKFGKAQDHSLHIKLSKPFDSALTFFNTEITSDPLQTFLIPNALIQTSSTTFVEQTVLTRIISKVLKLTFGAKTTYTTLYSTDIVPIGITTFFSTPLFTQPSVMLTGIYTAPLSHWQ